MAEEVKIKKFIEDDSRNFYDVNVKCHKWYIANKNNIKILSTIYGVTHMSEIDSSRKTNEWRRHLLVRYTGNAVDIPDSSGSGSSDEDIGAINDQLNTIEKRLSGIEDNLDGFVEIPGEEMMSIWNQ